MKKTKTGQILVSSDGWSIILSTSWNRNQRKKVQSMNSSILTSGQMVQSVMWRSCAQSWWHILQVHVPVCACVCVCVCVCVQGLKWWWCGGGGGGGGGVEGWGGGGGGGGHSQSSPSLWVRGLGPHAPLYTVSDWGGLFKSCPCHTAAALHRDTQSVHFLFLVSRFKNLHKHYIMHDWVSWAASILVEINCECARMKESK